MSGFSINRTTQSGNLTNDPELRSTPSGTSVCKFGIAVNDRIKDNASGEWKDRPNYFDVTMWGGMGEWVARNMHKGDAIALEGRLRQDRWTAPDGGGRSKVEIIAESIFPRPKGAGFGDRHASHTSEPDFQDGPPPGSTPDFMSDAPYEPPHTQPVSVPGSEDDIPF